MRKAILIVIAVTMIAGCRPTPDYVHGPRMSLAAWKGTAHDLGAARGHIGLPP